MLYEKIASCIIACNHELGWKGLLKIIIFQKIVFLKALSSLALNNLGYQQDIHNSLDNLSYHSHGKKKISFFIFSINLPSFSLKALPLFLSPQTLVKRVSLPYKPPLSIEKPQQYFL